MTTIKPRLGGINLNVKHIDSEGYALIQIGDLPKQVPGMRTVSVAARYPVADILAALGAVSDKEHDDTLEALGEAAIQRQRIANDRDQWKGRAEKAEQKAADFEDRYETSHASRMHAEECYRREHDRAEKAEVERDALAATVERVRGVVHEFYKVRGDWYTEGGANALKAALLAALDPKPAFVLPTEAGVRFYGDHNGYQTEFTTYSNGSDALYVSDDGDIWTPLQMDKVTDLRGAE